MNSDSELGELRSKGLKLPGWHYWVCWTRALSATTAALTAAAPTSVQSARYDSAADLSIRWRRPTDHALSTSPTSAGDDARTEHSLATRSRSLGAGAATACARNREN